MNGSSHSSGKCKIEMQKDCWSQLIESLSSINYPLLQSITHIYHYYPADFRSYRPKLAIISVMTVLLTPAPQKQIEMYTVTHTHNTACVCVCVSYEWVIILSLSEENRITQPKSHSAILFLQRSCSWLAVQWESSTSVSILLERSPAMSQLSSVSRLSSRQWHKWCFPPLWSWAKRQRQWSY